MTELCSIARLLGYHLAHRVNIEAFVRIERPRYRTVFIVLTADLLRFFWSSWLDSACFGIVIRREIMFFMLNFYFRCYWMWTFFVFASGCVTRNSLTLLAFFLQCRSFNDPQFRFDRYPFMFRFHHRVLLFSELYSTRQKNSAPSTRRRRRARVKNIRLKLCEHIFLKRRKKWNFEFSNFQN